MNRYIFIFPLFKNRPDWTENRAAQERLLAIRMANLNGPSGGISTQPGQHKQGPSQTYSRHPIQIAVPHGNLANNLPHGLQVQSQAHPPHSPGTLLLPTHLQCRRDSFLYKATDSESEQDFDSQGFWIGNNSAKRRESAASSACGNARENSSITVEGYAVNQVSIALK